MIKGCHDVAVILGTLIAYSIDPFMFKCFPLSPTLKYVLLHSTPSLSLSSSLRYVVPNFNRSKKFYQNYFKFSSYIHVHIHVEACGKFPY